MTTKQIRAKQLDIDQVILHLRQNFGALMQVNNAIMVDNRTEPPTPRLVHWRRSIRKHHIVCLVCGLHARMLTGRHLARHGLTAKTYRQRYNMPRTQGLVCKDMAVTRRTIVQRVRPWEKSPAFIAAEKRAVAQLAMGR